MSHPAIVQKTAEIANNTNPHPLVAIFKATQMAPAMPVTVPVHFSAVILDPFWLLITNQNQICVLCKSWRNEWKGSC